MLRVVSELLWTVRRHGFEISPAGAIDAVRAVAHVGFDDREVLRAALRAAVVKRASDVARFDRAFDVFFEEAGHPNDLFGRLAARGFAPTEIDAVRQLLVALAQQAGGGGEVNVLAALGGHAGDIEHLVRGAGMRRVERQVTGPSSIGFFVERAARELGVSRAATVLSRMKRALADAVGEERASLLAAALGDELELLRARIRLRLEARIGEAEASSPYAGALDVPFAGLAPAEAEDVRRALRTLALRLRGAARVRERRAGRGRFDARRTARASLRTAGVPIRVARKLRRRDRPKLVVVCDVSDSVRSAAGFLLELVAATSELFRDVRSFVFIADVGETTELFRDETRDRALARIASGAVVPIAGASNYGRALAEIERLVGRSLDRRTTVVILGDGRTNLHAHGAEIVRRLRDRSRGVLWLSPESRATWGLGDSAMPRYVEASTEALAVRTGRELEEAARRLVRFRA